jgi:hypothetical protein
MKNFFKRFTILENHNTFYILPAVSVWYEEDYKYIKKKETETVVDFNHYYLDLTWFKWSLSLQLT